MEIGILKDRLRAAAIVTVIAVGGTSLGLTGCSSPEAADTTGEAPAYDSTDFGKPAVKNTVDCAVPGLEESC